MDETLASRLQILTIQFPPFVVAVIFHEFAHGLVAKFWGDRTAEQAGRLTLNPIPHMDLFGTVLFPLINMATGMNILFGWAKPVPIDPRQFRKFRPGLFWVSLAGPGMNFLIAFASALVFATMRRFVPQDFYLYEPFLAMTYVSVSLNFALGIFNLIPLPPLDGSKILEAFLPYDLARKYEQLAQYSFWILMALLISGAFAVLSGPIRFFTDITLYVAARILQLPEVMGTL